MRRFTNLADHGASFCPAPQAAPVTVCLGKAGIAALSQVLHMAPPLLEDPEVLLIALYQGNSTSFNVLVVR